MAGLAHDPRIVALLHAVEQQHGLSGSIDPKSSLADGVRSCLAAVLEAKSGQYMKFVDPKPEHFISGRVRAKLLATRRHMYDILAYEVPALQAEVLRKPPYPLEHYSHLADVLGDTIFDPAPFWLSALDAQMRDQTIVESGQSRRHGSGEYFFKAGDPSKLLFLTDEFAKIKDTSTKCVSLAELGIDSSVAVREAAVAVREAAVAAREAAVAAREAAVRRWAELRAEEAKPTATYYY